MNSANGANNKDNTIQHDSIELIYRSFSKGAQAQRDVHECNGRSPKILSPSLPVSILMGTVFAGLVLLTALGKTGWEWPVVFAGFIVGYLTGLSK